MTAYSISYKRQLGRKRKVHCARGHNLTETRVIYNGCYGCLICHRLATSEYRKRNPTKTKEQGKRQKIRAYGITEKQYEHMYAEQEGTCAICHTPESQLHPDKTLGIDHNHVTGHVRGLLCGRCNSAIGLLKESDEIILSMLSYLQEHRYEKAA